MLDLKSFRGLVEQVPPLAHAYRRVRDWIVFQRSRPVPTPHGFLLAGNLEMQRGRFEPVETRIISGLLDDVDVFVDVGANVGYYTCFAANQGCDVVAVEPSRVNFRYLRENVRANRFDNVEIVRAGLAANDGRAKLFGTGGGASTIRGWKPGVNQPSETIPTTTLDRVLESMSSSQRILVKMDIEGAEYAALAGSRATLERQVAPVWFIEIYLENATGRRNPVFAGTFELFFDHGYRAAAALEPLMPVSFPEIASWQAGSARPPTANFLFSRDL